MHDETLRSDPGLSRALRALPLQSPEDGGWARLAQELQPAASASRHRRFYAPFGALAACALLVVAFVALKPSATVAPVASSNPTMATSGVANVTNAANDKSGQLDALQARSRELEQWLHDTAEAGVPLQGQDAVAADEIESLIGVIDVELAAPQQHDESRLWQRRVSLLEDLTTLRYSNYRLAASAAQGDDGRPKTWIN